MSPKAKKTLYIVGFAADIAITLLLFVFSIVLLANMPEVKTDINKETFLGWFQVDPIRILLIVVLPLCLLLVANIAITITYVKKNTEKKKVSLNDLSDEEKEALRKKILQEMLEQTDKK